MKEQLQAQITQKKKELAELEAKLAALPAKSAEERLLELLKSCTRIEVRNSGWVWYNDKNQWMLELTNSILWVNGVKIWRVFNSEYQMYDGAVQSLIQNVMEKHYKLSDTLYVMQCWDRKLMDKHYRLSGITPKSVKAAKNVNQ